MTPGQRATALETAALYGLDPGPALERIGAELERLLERYRAGAYGGAILWAPAYSAAHTVCTNIINHRPEES